MVLNERNPASATLLYQRARFSLAALLTERLLKIVLRFRERLYVAFRSGYSANIISALCRCRGAHFSGDLNRAYRPLAKSALSVSPFS